MTIVTTNEDETDTVQRSLAYDGIGNPESDGVRSYTWEHGRQLASLTMDGVTWNYTYNSDGLRTVRTSNSKHYSYVYNGDKLAYMTAGDKHMYFAYDANGTPMSIVYSGTVYYYVTNVQGDVIALVDSTGAEVVSYSYDAWGNPLETTGTLKDTLGVDNPLRYRGYVYDQETKLYYLQSRYYNPEIGRFINADDIDYLGADGSLTSYNLFAYCGNNPVMGYDPTGYWDWGGVLVGVGIIAATVITVATCGIGTFAGALVASAFITTGVTMTYAAATDSAMVMDLSYSFPNLGPLYGKVGASMVIDFEQDEINVYGHAGVGIGYTGIGGVSYSTGLVSNYTDASDYSKHFFGWNEGLCVGLDHSWNPLVEHDSSTQATCVTFSGTPSCGVEYNYYSDPSLKIYW